MGGSGNRDEGQGFGGDRNGKGRPFEVGSQERWQVPVLKSQGGLEDWVRLPRVAREGSARLDARLVARGRVEDKGDRGARQAG